MFYTKRFMLRAFDVEADLQTVTQWFNDEDGIPAISPAGPAPAMKDEVKKVIEGWANKKDQLPVFAICERPDDERMPKMLSANDNYFVIAGRPRYPAIGFLHIGNGGVPRDRSATFGIFIDKQHQDQGCGTEVLLWALEYSFQLLGLHRIELGTASTNSRALHVYQKVGFVREGLRRKKGWRNGEWRDVIEMGILEDDWREKASKKI